MSSRRKLWPFGLGLLVLLVAAAATGWFVFRLRVARAATALLEDAVQMALEPRTRPVHTAASITGSFGKCAEPRLDNFVDLLEHEPETCKAFRAPGAPPGKIPDECLALVTPRNSLAWARGLMTCSRADTAGLPEGIFSAGHKRSGPGFVPWIQAARVLAWEIRAEVATGQYGLAFETCADVIATSRELSWGGALLGTMSGVAIVKTVYPACAEAVAGADAASRAKFHTALELIRSSKRLNSAMLRDEAVVAGVEHFGFELDGRQRQSLPKELRDRIRPPPSQFPTPILLGWQMAALQALNADLRQVADLPEAERAPLLKQLALKHEGTAAFAPSVASMEKFLRRADEAATLIQMLSAAAHADIEPPATTATYTVTPVDGAVELAALDPEAAKYSIRIPLKAK